MKYYGEEATLSMLTVFFSDIIYLINRFKLDTHETENVLI